MTTEMRHASPDTEAPDTGHDTELPDNDLSSDEEEDDDNVPHKSKRD